VLREFHKELSTGGISHLLILAYLKVDPPSTFGVLLKDFHKYRQNTSGGKLIELI
jgi:hypothetical protein